MLVRSHISARATPTYCLYNLKLFYKSSRLRVVISTANLVEIDFRDLENVVVFIYVLPHQLTIRRRFGFKISSLALVLYLALPAAQMTFLPSWKMSYMQFTSVLL
jgi:hypothetical protein